MNYLLRMASILTLVGSAGGVQAVLPATSLEPVYHALFTNRASVAWQQLINLWPQLSSDVQRRAWQDALDALIAQQCGNNLPVTVPEWLDHPTLQLIQRDIPLNRIYRVRLSGTTSRRNVQVSLTLPSGEDLLVSAVPTYDTNGQFIVESKELGQALPPGVYDLRFVSGSEVWHQLLALQGVGGLNWIRREGRPIKTHLPSQPSTCPAPWLEQAVLKRPNFEQIYWRRADVMKPLQWPQIRDAELLWGSVSVVRSEARGGITVRNEHRLAGPFLTIKN